MKFEYVWHKMFKRPYRLVASIDEGTGQPVVLLHGLAASGISWKTTAGLFDKNQHRVIALDLLGFGDSPQPDWLEYSVEDHAKAVIASLNKLKIHQPVVLVGHSMGSLVAAYIAKNYPKRVKHLILYQIPLYEDRQTKRELREFRQQLNLWAFRYISEHPKLTLWSARKLARVASEAVDVGLTEQYWLPFEQSLRNTIIKQRPYENLQNLIMPVDVIYGKYDFLVLKKNIHKYFQDSETVRIYEIDETHRISAKASQLIYVLVTRKEGYNVHPKLKHVRLVRMSRPRSTSSAKSQIQNKRPLYALISLMSLVILMMGAAAAWQGRLPAWEATLFTSINSWIGISYTESVARIFSDFVWAVVFIVAAALLIARYRLSAWRIAVPAVCTYVFVYIVEHIVGRARPDVLLKDDAVLRAMQDGMGYPSGHVAVITAVAIIIWSKVPAVAKVIAALIVAGVALSRVYLGVHFPLDVIGGFAAGFAVAFGLKLLPLWLQKRLYINE